MFSAHLHKKEAYFLSVLWSGLERLHIEVQACEKKELEILRLEAKARGFEYKGSFSSSFGSGPNDSLITNDFVWYASSAACFLQLFDHGFALAGSYRTAFPAMLKWRDKVSAHTAFSDPVKKHKIPGKVDSPESQDASIMMHPEWHNDHYFVGGITFRGSLSASHSDWKWSLTQVHPQIEAFVKSHL